MPPLPTSPRIRYLSSRISPGARVIVLVSSRARVAAALAISVTDLHADVFDVRIEAAFDVAACACAREGHVAPHLSRKKERRETVVLKEARRAIIWNVRTTLQNGKPN